MRATREFPAADDFWREKTPLAGAAVWDPHHRPFRDRGGLFIVRQTGHTDTHPRRQSHRTQWSQDRQLPFEVACSEVVPMMLRHCEDAQLFLTRRETKHGKARAMTTRARRIARTVYQMLKPKEAFDAVNFFAS